MCITLVDSTQCACIPGLMMRINYMFCISQHSDSGGTILQAKSGNEASLTTGDNLVVPTHADEMAAMLVFIITVTKIL